MELYTKLVYSSMHATNVRQMFFSNHGHFSNMAASGRYARVDDDSFMDDLVECSGSELEDSCVSDDGKLFSSIYSANCLTCLCLCHF